MMHVVFMKNFLLTDSSELLAFRLILVSFSPKTFDSFFLDMMYVVFMKIFFSPIPASYWLWDSFRPRERKNFWFLLSRHDVPGVHEKFLFPVLKQANIAVRLISAFSAQKRLIPTF